MFRSIAFGGGGMRGALHLGGLKALLQFQNTLEFPDGIYGYSIGSVIATALAFRVPLKTIERMIGDSMNLDAITEGVGIDNLFNVISTCGVLSMDSFEATIVKAFLSAGIDLRGKVIGDAPQKLFIGASNLTLRKPVFFTGQVPILTAIKASSCIPIVFRPQVVYDNVYVDGGIHMFYFDEFLPADCLSFIVSYSPKSIRPHDLNMLELLKQLYTGRRRPPTSKTAIWFKEDKVHVVQDITSDDKKRLVESGYSQTFTFITELLAQKST
jgi:hypothetical protein